MCVPLQINAKCEVISRSKSVLYLSSVFFSFFVGLQLCFTVSSQLSLIYCKICSVRLEISRLHLEGIIDTPQDHVWRCMYSVRMGKKEPERSVCERRRRDSRRPRRRGSSAEGARSFNAARGPGGAL